jgi:formylglycine-generating enzyme required for sulfatase activity
MLLCRPRKRTRPFLLLAATLAFSASAKAVTIATVPVGDLGNPNDPATGNLYGGVNYPYRIGKYEVTSAQYVAFLNAVAATDTYGLYDPSNMSGSNGPGIIRNGASGNYTYTLAGAANHPVNYVTWADAARFANWLHNGQPTGLQNTNTTEDGAYTLNGTTSESALVTIARNVNAKWFIPSESEWYKAAYYQPATKGGDSDSYWAYPMRTNGIPFSDQPPGATPDNTRVANFNKNDGVANGYDDGYAVTGSTSFDIHSNYMNDVGAYVSSASYYGTFDQGGNVGEWNDAIVLSGLGYRGMRGQSFLSSSVGLAASYRENVGPRQVQIGYGFRLATVASAEDVGDFNHDGLTDAADYIVFRKNNGAAADYNAWRAYFNESIPGGGASFATSIPEPSSMMLLMVALATFVARGKRR